jgi:hypothetical protein
MIGLERFAAANAIPPADKPELAKYLLALLKQADPPAGRSAEGHAWMRRIAAQLLTTMSAGGADPAVVGAMAAIIADRNASPSLRCEIAEQLGQLKYPPDAKIDYTGLANLLGHQLVEICRPELAGSATGAVDQSDSRRRSFLAYATISTLHGLEGTNGIGGLVGATKAGDKQKYEFINGLRTKVGAMSESLEKAEQVDMVDLTAKLDELQGSLLAKPAPPSPPPAQEKAQTADIASQPPPARAPAARPASGGN